VSLAEGAFAPVPALYTNWRGETAERLICPVQIEFGANRWHPVPQWLLQALDAETGQYRAFALSGFLAWGTSSPSPTAALARSAVGLNAELLAAIRSAIEVLTQHEGEDATVQAALEILADADASASPPPADLAFNTPEPR